ncbi:C6 zinc finger domain protein [Colletotrichum karsti]|uniref:C6 zinc finger domain protein n=1 Tax=Colletotrichum karsti TaxID=1095194 RepID=A0A9P6I382_9PEZI|nr:C6 zinc finger domain protein [Colletotrichum karsti]KAF9876488.1 C6 zinc finger domain protein [Colletotrichum karsti]
MSAADPLVESDPADKSRQKSCNACVRSKRRCDKRTPRCTRCAEKNFSCVYQNLPPSGGGGGGPSSSAGEDPLQAMDLEDNTTAHHLPPAPHPFDFNTLDSSPSGSTPGTYINGTLVLNEPETNGSATATTTTAASSLGLNLDPNMGFDFNSVMDFLNADPVQGGEMQLWETPQVPTAPKTLAPDLPYMGSVCCGMERDDILPPVPDKQQTQCMSQGDFQPWQIHEPDSRIGYMVNYIKDLHLTFARTKQTPFIHRHLYRGVHSTPRPLLAAYTAISAYAGRTDSNRGWAIRAICEGAAEVLKTAKDAAASAAMTGHEKLARAQALWLLQTIRCFDGDVALRAQAERDMGVLKRWLTELEGLRDNLDDVHLLDDLALRQRPPRSWEVWVFNECVRRTVLMGHIFTSLFEILKAAGETEPSVANWMAPHRWTFSKGLWDSQSSPAFFSAWREKPLFMINSFFVQEVAKVARPVDVDEFARLFLTINFGVEETKHFMLEAS